MIIHTKIQKWGNGLAIRIAGVMREIPNFQVDMPIEVDVSEGGLVIKKSIAKSKIFPFTEEELLADLNEHNSNSDLLATPLDSEF